MKHKADIQPRMLSFEQMAALMGYGDQFIRDHAKEWKTMGFPLPERHPLLKLYDSSEIHQWIEKTKVIGIKGGERTPLLEKIQREGIWQ